jgi:HK97 family phage portal protein
MKAPALFHGLLNRVARKDYQAVDNNRGGWFRVLEPFTGAFQRNIEVNRDSVLAYHAVFACITLIAQDIGKLRPKLVKQQPNGIWRETANPAYSPLLRKPNRFQNRIKFFENWITSKLIQGNAYALKGRDSRGVVNNLYLLDPCRVRPLVADNGDVFYELKTDKLRELPETVIVPADEIIHDPMVCLFHPLVGVSPIFACGLGAQQGVNIQQNSSVFFGNMSRPGGILTAPGHIEDDTAARVKTQWEEKFGGANVGRTAVLGDGLEWKPISINAEDSQLIEQLKWTAEMVCSCFHVPPFMIGVGQMPAFNNIEALYQAYYSQCLQTLIESMELCLDEGLGLVTATESFGVELDLTGLLRMDTAARFDRHSKGVQGGWMMPNEARLQEDLDPVTGGDTPYMQQQNYSLSELNIRRVQAEARADQAGDDEAANIQSTAMNGAQVASLQALITSAAAGDIPAASARAAISAAFPLLTDEEIDAMISPLTGFKPPSDEPAPSAPEPTEPVEPEEPEEEDEEIDELSLDDMLTAEFPV